jgi:hypothetical protein
MHFEVESARLLILIKTILSKKLPVAERHSSLRKKLAEWGIWEKCFWEHSIQYEFGYNANIDYLLNNPIKLGLVEQVAD